VPFVRRFIGVEKGKPQQNADLHPLYHTDQRLHAAIKAERYTSLSSIGM
jgi:hypothetical protein